LTRCGRCRVRIAGGAAAPSEADREVFGPAELRDGWRLACTLTVSASVAIEVPGQTRAVAPKGFGTAVSPDPDRVPVLASAAAAGRARFGLAVDIGTTTLAAALIDVDSGVEVAAGSLLNPQAEFGADVMSRIHAAGGSDERRRPITAAVRRGLATLAGGLVRDAGLSDGHVTLAAVVGNPDMLHLWRGEDT